MSEPNTRAGTTLPALLTLPGDQQADLARAVATLEGPSVAARIAGVVGTSVDALKARLPGNVRDGVDGAVRRALEQAWRTAVSTEPRRTPLGMSPAWFHRGLVAATGAAGGALGFLGTLAELPISTTLMLRQIAAEAAAAGEDPKIAATAAECLAVFALGSPRTAEDDPAESGYFAARLALAQLLPNAATSLTSSILPGFLGAIAARFTGAMGLKLSAQAVPVVGAATGAAINLAFMNHFQSTAWAHFTVRRLERQYGEGRIASAYKALRDGTAA
ncbi:EcsC family protein [Roseomonas sp. CCTCC AB2023176]|uniref:EcsC family protein n=1 Tax=Roseomonas sp. CCTCC AB2023176 TaxID=3342640 RepID=UPI0035DAFE92